MKSEFSCGKVNYTLVLLGIKECTGCGTQTSPSYSGSGVAVCVFRILYNEIWSVNDF